jgi:hypothetical protein
MKNSSFEVDFRALMSCAPFGWQNRLYQRLIRGEVRNCNIPTGLGKTAVIAAPLKLLLWPLHIGDNEQRLPRLTSRGPHLKLCRRSS